MPNARNSPIRHAAVGAASIAVALLLYLTGYPYQQVAAVVPYLLLFLTVAVGPVQVIWPRLRGRYRGQTLNVWRSEIGIWFVLWGVLHVALVVDVAGAEVLWSRPWAFAATVALVLAVVLMFTSNHRLYRYMGPKAWKWHQSHATYVLFYLLTPHIWHRAYLIPGGPSTTIHWIYLATLALVPLLHVTSFVKVVRHYQKEGQYPPGVR